ncbi:MAG: hypothetical protein QNJ41_03200 [Xenococcaceae cyanobacterium MO_188.B32]|nr:hypothetical protein [Xenococcaceae cyanobacterium MO_188.B32]
MSKITQAEVQELADVWYKKLDVHAPLEEFKPLLADAGVKMVFPEATVEGWEGFSGWYERVIGIFFDEVHTLKEVTTTPKGDDKADVKVVVKWEASVWKPPAPTSERIVLDAYQTWEVQRSPETGKPVVLTYIVDELKYYEGSAKL